MYVVVMNLYIDGGVQLDSSDLISEIFMLYRDIINMVMGNLAEDTAHMAHDTILSAVIYLIVADYMGTDRLLAPADLSCPEYGFHLILVSRLSVGPGTEIMASGGFLSNTDSAAFCIVNLIVLNDPALAPVRSQKSWLICGRRGPRACRLGHLEAAYRDIV